MAPRKKYIITKKSKKLTNKTSNKPDNIIQEHNKLNQKHHTIKHKYTKYYPSIYDSDFSHKIAKHGIFKKYKLTVNQKRLNDLYNAFETNTALPEDSKKHDTNIYILKPFQKMLRNFMSPYTPYRSILIYHEMGVGKTCTAITIAESLKNIVKNSDSKIYVIRPDELERQIFDVNVVHERKPLNQCTGDTYLQNPKFADLIKNCMGGNDNSCEQLKAKVNKEIRNIYEFAGSQLWARKVQSEIDLKTRNIVDSKLIEEKTKTVIQNMFNNSVIIVDEAHELRDSNEKEAKIVPPILNKVLKYSLNLRIIFLSATPIYDKPQNIVSLINYFLLNDKRPLMKESELFDLDGNLKPTGREILERNTVGYISYLRGSNPYDFPIRISARYNIPNKLVNLDNYPLKDIKGKKLNKNDKIKHLELVDCKLSGAQLEILNYHVRYDKIPDLDEDDMDKLSSVEPVFDTPLTDTEEYESSSDESSSDESELEEAISTKKTTVSRISKKSKQSKIQKYNTQDEYREKTVAYLFERQISNIVYQTLDECSNNIKLAVGDLGLSQIVKKQHGKWTYEFTDPKYATRFKLPELYNWGAKIAQAVELAIQSTGPVFIYTYFNSAGVIPLAFALEMNGFRRYKQHGTPLLETHEKDKTYRGDYIIYTGKQSLSTYAKEYIDKRRKMIYETSVKVFIGSSKASEGLNLFGYREAHILDPWHNINLTEQSIGRVIRTGSHLHLPPQERNVTVYQYAATLDDRESIDLKIYKISEGKAIKAGVIEKILKENALDCELNKDVNIYDSIHYNRLIPLKTSHNKQIKVSLADTEYSRSCFYMKNCSFSCNRGSNSKHETHQIYENSEYAMPIMKFNYDKEVDEYKNLIIQLLSKSFNVKINNLRQYLKKLIYGEQINQTHDIKDSKKYIITKKTKKQGQKQSNEIINQLTPNKPINDDTEWDDEDAFTSAVEELINNEISIKDKFGRDGKIILSGEYLRFIPEGSLIPNISIQKQNMKTQLLKSEIDLKGFITKINEEQKRLVDTEELNYDEIMHNTIEIIEKIFYGVYQKEYKFNVKIKFDEIIDIIFSKLVYTYKLTILKNILKKLVHGTKLTDNEYKFENIIKKHIVYIKDVFPDTKTENNIKKSIYGFIIQNENKLELYILNANKEFEKNQGNLRKVIEHHRKTMNKTPNNKLYGFLKYEKGRDIPLFKITDVITKGEKKSVIGFTCFTNKTHEIKKILNKLDDRVLKDKNVLDNKNMLCNDIELIMKRNDANHVDGKKWYYTPEEYEIYFGSQA